MSEVDPESILQDLKDLLESQNDNRELMQGLRAKAAIDTALAAMNSLDGWPREEDYE